MLNRAAHAAGKNRPAGQRANDSSGDYIVNFESSIYSVLIYCAARNLLSKETAMKYMAHWSLINNMASSTTS